MTRGRLVAIGFGVLALVCLVLTFDYSRGRLPETDSAFVAEVLGATTARECGRDATEIALRHFPLGIGQAEVEKRLETVAITPPRPWFWRPAIENATTWTGPTLEALRTIKATAFGNNLLRMHMTFEDGRLKRLAAEVVCRFE